MRRLILLSVVPLFLAALMAGVRAYSQSHPDNSPATLYGYGLCEGSPCFLGIRPGVTTLEEAQKIVRTHYPKATIGTGSINIGYGANEIIIEQASEGNVYNIQIDPVDSSPIRLADVIVRFGPPCATQLFMSTCQFANCPLEGMDLYYDSTVVGLDLLFPKSGIEVERLTLDFPVRVISLSQEFSSSGMYFNCKDALAREDYEGPAIPWMSFTSIRQHYYAYDQRRSKSHR